jgi:hypothetical protein
LYEPRRFQARGGGGRRRRRRRRRRGKNWIQLVHAEPHQALARYLVVIHLQTPLVYTMLVAHRPAPGLLVVLHQQPVVLAARRDQRHLHRGQERQRRGAAHLEEVQCVRHVIFFVVVFFFAVLLFWTPFVLRRALFPLLFPLLFGRCLLLCCSQPPPPPVKAFWFLLQPSLAATMSKAFCVAKKWDGKKTSCQKSDGFAAGDPWAMHVCLYHAAPTVFLLLSLSLFRRSASNEKRAPRLGSGEPRARGGYKMPKHFSTN